LAKALLIQKNIVTLHKICARTGCTSAKSKLSALGLHRPCHTHFERDANLFIAQFLSRTATSNEIFMSKTYTSLELRTIAQSPTIVVLGL